MLLEAPATLLDKVNQKPIAYLDRPKSAGREFPVLSDQSMEHRQGDQLLSETRRREIFLALVDAQDCKMGVLESRQWIAKR